MINRGRLVAVLAIGSALLARAQQTGEMLAPLHAMPRGAQEAPTRAADLHEFFIYHYPHQTLPVVDDFSIDRTQHLDAKTSDAGVTYNTTVYHLEVNNVHPPVLNLSLDTNYFYVIDTTQVDTVITTINALPSVEVVIFDISTFPSGTDTVTAWPNYTVTQFVGSDPDTVFAESADLFQDSLLVYDVAVDGRTYIRPDLSTVPLILWQEDEAYVNNTYGILPPSIGVATFDGMDRTGYPYDPESPLIYGVADHLTSVPIDLTSVPGDSVYLSFFIQPIGNSGDSVATNVQAEDSLRLEFMSNNDGIWRAIRSWPQTTRLPFRQIMVPITDPAYLQDNFRMRFTNKASYGGAIDQWQLDYVRLGRNRSYTDTVLQDVAYVYGTTTMLSPYTSVPYAKFTQDPGLYMAQSVDLLQRNNDNADKFITWGYESGEEAQPPTVSCTGYGNNLSNNHNAVFNSSHPIAQNPCNNTYATPAADAMFYRNAFWTNATPDVNQYNDSVIFTQELSNYYSYDDGTAEWGYSLVNAAGGKIAYRFDTQGDDSLRAVRMYFDPIFSVDDPNDASFLITVWDQIGSNEHQIFQNLSFSKPEFKRWGPDHFVEYELDSTIHVSGTFYVGFVQTNATQMNLGFDATRVNNDRMFFFVQGVWAQSQKPGSWMMRPVMVSGSDPFAGVEEVASDNNELTVWPNPTDGAVTIALADHRPVSRVQIMDATGRIVSQTEHIENGVVRTEGLTPGLYLLRALDGTGRTLGQQRMIVQH